MYLQPSSSGRSAELLNNAVNLESWKSPGGAKMATLFPTLTSPIIDPGLTTEFSVCIKKLNKKDPITKTKVKLVFYAFDTLLLILFIE